MKNTFLFKTKKAARDAANMLGKATGEYWRVVPNVSEGADAAYKFAATNAPVPMKTVRNLMSGKDIQIPADTPFCCDPSTETYWSM